MQDPMQTFDGPIPGQALTEELGSAPHERPPQFSEPKEALQYMWEGLISEEGFKRLAIATELGVPVELIVRSLVFSGWAKGTFSFDTMLLIFGMLFDLTLRMLKEEEIPHMALAKRKEDDSLAKSVELLKEQRDMVKKLEEGSEEVEDVAEEVEPVEEIESEELSDTPTTGLMGRAA
jgi:hypothetical protein|tara:strand:- start:558 stop:1088 length:531 start_codon:yes stop_codon:yes gene_type:complete